MGKLQFPDEMLKRIMKKNVKDEKEVEEKYEASVEELKWHLIKERLVKTYDVKVNDEDVLKLLACKLVFSCTIWHDQLAR